MTSAGREPLHFLNHVPVDRLQLGGESLLGGLIEPIPEGQQMLLISTLQGGDDGRGGSHPRTHLQSSMHRSGKPMKITE